MTKIFSLLVPVLIAVSLSEVLGVGPKPPPPPVDEIKYVCPDNWCKYERTCYNPVKASGCVNSVVQAQSECKKFNASLHLVSIHNQDNAVEQFVAGFGNEALTNGKKNIFIGITDQIGPKVEVTKSGIWQWLPNYLEGYLTGFLSSIGFSNVACATPRVKRTSPPKIIEIPALAVPCVWNFAQKLENGQKRLSCSRDAVKQGEEVNLICERPAEPACEEGWRDLKGICYRAYSNPAKAVTHDEAEALCVKENAHLVSVHNQAQQEFLTKLLGDVTKTFNEKKNRGLFYFWNGMKLEWKDDSKLVKFEWADKSPIDFNHPLNDKGKKPWDGKNPDNEYEGVKTCVLMYGNEITIGGSSEYAGEWQDAPCDNSGDGKLLPILAVRSYICQKPGRVGTCDRGPVKPVLLGK